MKTIYSKSNILLALIILFVFVFATIKILQLKKEKITVTNTTHSLNYINCIFVEDNVNLIVTEGDSNKIYVAPNIEMFYTSGCLTIYGKGNAILNVEKNTLEMIATKNNATVKVNTNASIKFLQAYDNSSMVINLKNKTNYIEITAKDNSIIKINAPLIDSLNINADNNALIKINSRVNKIEKKLQNNAKIKTK